VTDNHAVSFNWARHSEVNSLIRPVPDTVRHMLTRLDGEATWAFALWQKTPGHSPGRISFSAEPEEFLQSAGSAEAMTVELRRREADGEYHQYAVARPAPEPGTRDVSWASNDPARPHRLTVPAAEVYDAAQAADVYAAYYATDDVPAGYRLRPVDQPDA
jgi:hypothetical protein